MARPARRFIESQIRPVTQAFGFEGGWGVERRAGTKKKGKRAELRELAASTPPWPCARRGCGRMIQWEPERQPRHRRPYKYCSKRCYSLARSRRDDRRRAQKSAAQRAAFAPLWKQLKAHGVTQVRLARRLGVASAVVCNVFAGRTVSRRVVDTARQMLQEPPIPPPARLSPEEKRARDRVRSFAWRQRLAPEQVERIGAYKREWRRERKRHRLPEEITRDRERHRAYKLQRYRSRTPEQIARDRERSQERWRSRTPEQRERQRNRHRGRYCWLTEERRARLRAYKRAWERQRRARVEATLAKGGR